MPWSPQQQRRAPVDQQPQQCAHVPGPSTSDPFGVAKSGGGELPEGVYRQLREVDQGTSTLTARGVQGFSARVLNREEFKYGQGGGGEARVVQLVEIIKKPGQSLGLYLREGNGVDQFTGVFVSRFGDNSELQRCGDILRPGDQILAVNNVLVREMAIDDVVLMLSIPRRLLLRTSFLKGQREQQAMRGPAERVERPVVVFQKVPETDRRDSEASSSGILSKPASTAASWLGRKVRQQQQQKRQQQQQPLTMGDQRVFDQCQQQQIRHRQYPPQQQNMAHHPSSAASATLERSAPGDAVAQTARIPPPRVQPIQPPASAVPSSSSRAILPPFCPSVFHPPAFSSATLDRRRPLPPCASAPLQRRPPFSAVPLLGFSPPIGVLPPMGSAARVPTSAAIPMSPPQYPHQPSIQPHRTPPYGAFLPGEEDPLRTTGPMMAPYKSNSLPRRRLQSAALMGGDVLQNIRWRNDLLPQQPPPPGSSLPFYANPSPPTYSPRGGGAFSDVEIGRKRRNLPRNGTVIGGMGRTVADIFSAQEYRNWASEDEDICGASGGGRRSRWTDMVRAGASVRSNSLPPKTVMMANHIMDSPRGQQQPRPFPSAQQKQQMAEAAEGMSPAEREKADILDRLHVSPLTSRRVPLRTAGPGFDVDRLSGSNSLSGVLSVAIVEGRNLKVPDRVHSKQLYCVLEVDEQHRARTGISTPEQHFRWAERFDIDVLKATNASFFIYAWHPQLRHRFCHKGDIRLMDVFLVDGLSANRLFTLQLEPRGQLLLKVSFADMGRSFSRIRQPTEYGVFGQPLGWLVQREKAEVPLVLSRLVGEIERRGLDLPGLYFLCGASDRKEHLRAQFNENSQGADISERPVPDVNLLTCLVKDFLRELPEPLVPSNIYAMLVDAAGVMAPSADREGNQKLVMRIVDCLPTSNKNSLVFLMDHFRALLASEPHNGLTLHRLTSVFGPLLFCSAAPSRPSAPPPSLSPAPANSSDYQSSVRFDPLSAQQAGQALRLLLDHWPRVNNNSSESNSSGGGDGNNNNSARKDTGNGKNNEERIIRGEEG